jgi:hypothetical protein
MTVLLGVDGAGVLGDTNFRLKVKAALCKLGTFFEAQILIKVVIS